MRISLLFILIHFSLSSSGQIFPNLKIEKFGVDKNNKIYTPGKSFTFSYTIEREDGFYYTDKNSFKEYSIAPVDEKHSKYGETKLFILKGKWLKRTNTNQTEIGFTIRKQDSTHSVISTGLVENEENVWTHPPRYGFFNCLQTCPYPYVKYPLEVGKEWEDQLATGSFFADELWLSWESSLLQNFSYKVTEELILESQLGKIPCFKIESKSESKLGTTYMTFFFSEEYGFVKMDYRWENGMNIIFTLTEVNENPAIQKAVDIFNLGEL